MTSETLPQSLEFLTDAAHLLVKTAPETSAYLMTRRNSLIFHNDLEQSDLQRQHVCGACGHIMIPGQGSELKIETNMNSQRKKLKRKKDSSKAITGKSTPIADRRKKFTCGMCGRYTDIVFPPVAPISGRRLLKPTKSMSLGTAHRNAPIPSEPAKVSASASSKKRAKSRKQGLQALLQQAQSSASKSQSGLGLSLSDFMSK
ncbi:uncharacterized protein F4817DRAFT_99425 [Daldinia loculata]|uniref:uncharacterized protein n=1 Tax=Daldinia loculata TaxID=103429 RepID=UPI0020C56520|nr:uncharacterized protein F4817DRAFT_99425 [Daldinia loculata]KAI1647747.1 hypothetical protein F4817DRAFT_99425 [Daldinia loculata]